MYAAERQKSQPYLQQVAGPLYEQWYLLHHRMIRIITNHPAIAEDVRSYLYYAELLADYTYEDATQLPLAIPENLLWQVGTQVYRPIALTCYLFQTRPDEPFPPPPLEPKPEESLWEEISGVKGPLRSRWKRDGWRLREYQAYPGVTSRIYSALHKEDLYATIYIEDIRQCRSWFLMRFVFYMVLGAMLSYNGYEIIHAGAIAQNEMAALLIGSPGSGKTTLVLSCLQIGMQHLADDVLFLARDDELIYTYAFPEDIGVRTGTLDLLGQHEFMQNLVVDQREKLFVDVQQHFRSQVIGHAPIHLLLFVHAKDRDTDFRAEPIAPAQAVSLLVQEYISRQEAQESAVEDIFELFVDLVAQAPAYRLWLTPNARRNAEQVRLLLKPN